MRTDYYPLFAILEATVLYNSVYSFEDITTRKAIQNQSGTNPDKVRGVVHVIHEEW